MQLYKKLKTTMLNISKRYNSYVWDFSCLFIGIQVLIWEIRLLINLISAFKFLSTSFEMFVRSVPLLSYYYVVITVMAMSAVMTICMICMDLDIIVFILIAHKEIIYFSVSRASRQLRYKLTPGLTQVSSKLS